VIDKKLIDDFCKRISEVNGYIIKGDLSDAHTQAIKLWMKAHSKRKSKRK